jgi:hypothetical protein
MSREECLEVPLMVVVGIVAAGGGGRKLLGDAAFSGTL